MDLPESVQRGHAKDKEKIPPNEFKKAEEVKTFSSFLVDSPNTLVKLHNEAQVKLWLKNIIPPYRQPGGAISAGDCFFHSIADCLNQRSGKDEYSIQSLRIFCDEYVKDPKNSWVKAENIKDREDHNNYLERIRFTAEELLAKENAGQKLGLATWGRPKIEGKIFCEQYDVRIHVIQIQEDGAILRYLVDKNGETDDYNPEIDYHDLNILHIINYHNHFVPLLSTNLYIPETQRSVLQTINYSFDNLPVDQQSSPPFAAASITTSNLSVNDIHFGRRVTAGIYTTNAKSLEHLPTDAVIQSISNMQTTLRPVISTADAKIERISVEEDINAQLVVDEQKQPSFDDKSKAPSTIINQYSANVMYVTRQEVASARVSELKQQLKYYYQNYENEIKRIFGKPLALDKCFVNLAIVKSAHQKQTEQDKLNFNLSKRDRQKQFKSFKSNPKERTLIYSSYEDIYNTQEKEVVELVNLFNERDKKIPRRILVIGRAGIGKSVLCQYLTAFEWAVNNRWQDKFDAVIKIRLRNLTKEYYDKNPKLETIIEVECLDHTGLSKTLNKEEIAVTLRTIIHRTLIVLDGWDEFNLKESPCARVITELMKNQQLTIIILSRPYIKLNTKDFDLILECIGFTTENIPVYISRVCEDKTQIPLITTFLNKNPAIHSLAHVPILLDMICAICDEELRTLGEQITMTSLYNKMVIRLWKAYMDKQEELNANVDIEIIIRKREMAKQFFSLLAFMAMESNEILIPYSKIEKAIKLVYGCREEDVERIFKDILVSGFLNAADNNNIQCNYFFHHLTIQEYLAAQYWVSIFISHKAEDKEKARLFFIENKHNPRFEIMWWFVSGILGTQENKQFLQQFFDILHQNSQDIIELFDLLLCLRCLDECGVSLNLKQRSKLLKQIRDYIEGSFNQQFYEDKESTNLFFEYLKISRQVLNCPEISSIFINALKEKYNFDKIPSVAKRLWQLALSKPEIIETLSQLVDKSNLKNLDVERAEHYWVKLYVAEALIILGQANPELINALIKAMNGRDSQWKQKPTAKVLIKLKLTTPEIRMVLYKALKENEGEHKHTIAFVVGRIAQFDSNVLFDLCEIINNKTKDIQSKHAAIIALMHSNRSTPEVIDCLHNAISSSTDILSDDWVVKIIAIRALGRLSNQTLPSFHSTISLLLQILDVQKVDMEARRMAKRQLKIAVDQGRAWFLSGGVPPYPLALQERKESLPESLRKNQERIEAVYALGHLRYITDEINQALYNALYYDSELRERTIKTIGKLRQSSPEIIQALVKLVIKKIKDNGDYNNKKAAIKSLGKLRVGHPNVIEALLMVFNEPYNKSDYDIETSYEFKNLILQALGNLNQTTDTIIDTLCSSLSDPKLERCAVDALEKLGKGNKKILHSLREKLHSIRPLAAKALFQLGERDTEVVNIFLKELIDGNNSGSYGKSLAANMLSEIDISSYLTQYNVNKLNAYHIYNALRSTTISSLVKAYLGSGNKSIALLILNRLIQAHSAIYIDNNILHFYEHGERCNLPIQAGHISLLLTDLQQAFRQQTHFPLISPVAPVQVSKQENVKEMNEELLPTHFSFSLDELKQTFQITDKVTLGSMLSRKEEDFTGELFKGMFSKPSSTPLNSQLKILIKKYNLPDSSSTSLEKGLRNAVVNNCEEDLKIFIKLGVNVDAQDSGANKKTALHWAAIKRAIPCIKVLLEANAKFNIPDADSRTAYYYAEETKDSEIINLFSTYRQNYINPIRRKN